MNEANASTTKLIGVEVSASSLTVVSLDGAGNLLDAGHVPAERGENSPQQLFDVVAGFQDRFGETGNIGIALPGLISQDKMRVAYSTHFPEHSTVDIKEEVESAAGRKALIENDANAAAYGEYKKGAGRGSRNLFYITLGTGVGGAFILDGSIWRGAAGFAGEFGYLTINSEGLRLEDVASADNIVRRTRNRFNRDSTSSLNRFEEQAINLEEIVAAAENGDDFAQLMLERTGNYIGMGVASVINLLNIETIVIGGEIMQAGHLVLDSIISRAKELSFAPSFAKTTIVNGQLGQNAAAIGVALLANGL
ncbi:MAG TPA: ROK family protein [Pyrinomonadaceae bacterium]|jgi:glucokinase|nr:ROK family protein [Pyrinomonadaceae bacterium]